ncbi:MAG TPA: transporter [Rhodocyclaceae bacterium]|nr:transporter [Rhodocyclaceae bacterium]
MASCGSSLCSINTHWDTQGLANDGGLLVDLRYSYAKADRLRAGSSRISPDAPSGSDSEIEDKRTINQLLNLTADYTIGSRWNVALAVPLVMRDHTHTFDSSVSGPFTQQARFTELGDARVTGKYKFDLASVSSGSGIRFGLKLPTGAIDKTMSPPDPADPTTPYKLERSSQPGTGSTDAFVGVYYYRNLPGADLGWFASGQVQSAIATRDNYRPGNEVLLDIGMHYAIAPAVNLLLQLNGQHRARDTGINANVASGGYSWNLSPGVSVAVAPNTQIYALVQFPLKQYVNTDPADAASGQLTAPWSMTAGISYRF